MPSAISARGARPREHTTLQLNSVRMDGAVLAAAYGEHAGAVYGIAYRMLGDRVAAQDVVQDAFLKLWTGAAQFNPNRGPILGLLVTIARHKAIDGMRRVARRRRSEDVYCMGETSVHDGPELATELAQDARDVRSALVALPYEQRRVIEMAYFHDLTCLQISREITAPIGTVKSRMRLGMRKLAATLGDMTGHEHSATISARPKRPQTIEVSVQHDRE